MKYISAFALLVAAVSAQTSNLPGCAVTCGIAAVAQSGGCTITDYACLCKSSSYLSSFTTCIQASCSTTDLQTAAQYGQQICASVGVTISSTSLSATATGTAAASISSSVSSSASAAASSVSSSVSAASSSMSSSLSSISSSVSAQASSMSASLSSSLASLSSYVASLTASSTSRAAAPTQAVNWEVLGLGAAAIAALL